MAKAAQRRLPGDAGGEPDLLPAALCCGALGPRRPACCRDRPWCELVRGGGREMDAPYDQLGALVHCNVRIRDLR